MMSFGRHESREWAVDEATAEPIVRRAVEGGVIFFDTADVYNGGQSEIVTGRPLRTLFGMREEYVVATKVWGRTMPARTETRAPALARNRAGRLGWSCLTGAGGRNFERPVTSNGFRDRRSRVLDGHRMLLPRWSCAAVGAPIECRRYRKAAHHSQ